MELRDDTIAEITELKNVKIRGRRKVRVKRNKPIGKKTNKALKYP